MGMSFSPRLLARYKELLSRKEDYTEFLRVSKTKWPRTIRVNGWKCDPEWVAMRLRERGIQFEGVKGFPDMFRLGPHTPPLGGWWEVQQGFFHVQEYSSQLPARLFSFSRNRSPGERVLDMAAAPGNKTIQLAEKMDNKGSILAVEPNKERAKSLRFVLGKAGVLNTCISLQDALKLPSSLVFDHILLDAPCSGEGLLRKKPLTLKTWSEKYVQHKAKLQTQLILKAADLLGEGGLLVYSVCTLSPEECEGVVTTLIHERPEMKIVPISLPIVSRPGLLAFRNRTFSSGMEKTRRVYPQDNNSQSFYLACLTKTKSPKGSDSI